MAVLQVLSETQSHASGDRPGQVRRLSDLAAVAEIATQESTLRRAAADLGLEIPADQIGALLRFNELLQRWNSVYNLTAVRDATASLTVHVIDCLAAVPALRREMARSSGQSILDVGSGGGLPGVVLAITNPTMNVTCVDTVRKKAAFVTQVISELHLPNMSSAHRRVEDLAGSFELIASRAFSSLNDFVRIRAIFGRGTGFGWR